MRTRLRPVASEQEMDVEEARFGVRSIEARGQLLLNGEPVRMGGANRHSDHPRFGLIEPKDVVALDMKLMKAANMELSRISHYPAPVALLDWADENGVLIIEQCPIWGNAASQLASPGMQALFRSQLEEMIRRDWNHPSVIGWSVGNEYESASPQGVEWTREMSAFVRGLDPSRLTTLASMYAFQTGFARPEEEGSHHVDLINVNVYGAPERVDQSLDRIRARWPDRVILISEFGSLDALTLTDQERARYVREFLEQIRKRPYIAGASLWTFNDYRSRWPQASEDGYRHFGVVTRDRRTTPLYDLLREQFSPVVIRQVRPHEKAAQAAVRVAVRSDFPSYTIRDYAVRCTWLDSSRRPVGSASASLPLLKPSEEATATCACDDCGGGRAALRVEVMRPTGFAAAESAVDLR